MSWHAVRTARSFAVPLGLLWLVPGCGGPTMQSGPSGPAEGRLITAEQIEGMGARNAWEVLARAHVPLSFSEGRGGEPAGLSRRGPRSLTSRSDPLVIVDGVRTEGLGLLRDLAASDIAGIRVMSGIDATRRFGTGAGGGAILIEMKRGHRR